MKLRTTRLDDVIPDGDAPVGSKAWVLDCAMRVQGLLEAVKIKKDAMAAAIRALKEGDRFKLLTDAKGRPFDSWRAFCVARRPHGLGYEPEIIEACAREGWTPAQALAAAPALQSNGRPKKGKESIPLNSKGPTVQRLAARIRRDHPDIAKRVEAGEFKSIRAAAIEAGIVRVKTPLERAKDAIKKLDSNDRRKLAAWWNKELSK